MLKKSSNNFQLRIGNNKQFISDVYLMSNSVKHVAKRP